MHVATRKKLEVVQTANKGETIVDKLTNGHRGSIGESKATVGDASVAVEMNKHFISSRFHYSSCVITTESA